MTALRRLLPSQFNDDAPVPQERLAETLLELVQKFGAVSCETQTIHGLWRQEGEIYRDSLIRLFVDVSDTPENREFFIELKRRIKDRFQQLDIWLTTYPIEVI